MNAEHALQVTANENSNRRVELHSENHTNTSVVPVRKTGNGKSCAKHQYCIWNSRAFAFACAVF